MKFALGSNWKKIMVKHWKYKNDKSTSFFFITKIKLKI